MERIERLYDTLAKEYAEAFSGEHERKPMDQKVLRRFAEELRGRGKVWDLGCGPGQTTKFLWDLGVQVSGLDISGKLLEEGRKRYPEIVFRKGNLLGLDLESASAAGAVSFYAMVHFTKAQVTRALSEVMVAP
jgi:trans-aconitate methyltransferase